MEKITYTGDDMAGAPEGNTNSNRNNRLWGDTIRRAIIQGDANKLRKIADKLLEMAEQGDMQAIKELGDRLDGKPNQSIEQKTEVSGTLEVSTRPKLTTEEWLPAHGLGTATGTAK